MDAHTENEASRWGAVVITGGSSGIGKKFIERLAAMQNELFICNMSRSVPTFTDPEGVHYILRHHGADLSSPDEVFRAFSEVEAELAAEAPKGPMLLINNSGFGDYGLFPDCDLDKHLKMIDLNVKSVVYLTGLMLPLLKRRGGAILNVASTASFQPCPYMSTYGATKAFVQSWSLALSEDLRGSGVQALCLCPGPTRTEFFHAAGFEGEDDPGKTQPFVQTADEVVDAALRALRKGRALQVSGWSNQLLTAFSSKLPRVMASKIARRVMQSWRSSR